MVVVGNVYNCGTDPYATSTTMPFILKRDRTRWSGSGFDWTVMPAARPGQRAPLRGLQRHRERASPTRWSPTSTATGSRRSCTPPTTASSTPTGWTRPSTGAGPTWSRPGAGRRFRFASEPVVADLDNDGRAEVIFTSWPEKGGGPASASSTSSTPSASSSTAVDLPAPAVGGELERRPGRAHARQHRRRRRPRGGRRDGRERRRRLRPAGHGEGARAVGHGRAAATAAPARRPASSRPRSPTCGRPTGRAPGSRPCMPRGSPPGARPTPSATARRAT